MADIRAKIRNSIRNKIRNAIDGKSVAAVSVPVSTQETSVVLLNTISGIGVVMEHDAAITSSYSGSGTRWLNLEPNPADGAAQATYDLKLGDESTTSVMPVFTGSAGTISAGWKSLYDSTSAGVYVYFEASAATTFTSSMSHGGTDWWAMAAFKLGASKFNKDSGTSATFGILMNTGGATAVSASTGLEWLVGISAGALQNNLNIVKVDAGTTTRTPNLFNRAIKDATEPHILIMDYNSATSTATLTITASAFTTTLSININGTGGDSNVTDPLQLLKRGSNASPFLANTGAEFYHYSMGNTTLTSANKTAMIQLLENRHVRNYNATISAGTTVSVTPNTVMSIEGFAQVSANNIDTFTSGTGPPTNTQGVIFNSAGTTMIVTGYFEYKAFRYTLGTPWEVGTATSTKEGIISDGIVIRSLDISPDGLNMIVGNNQLMGYYTMASAYDVAAITTVSTNIDVSTALSAGGLDMGTYGGALNSSMYGFRLNASGTYMTMGDATKDKLYVCRMKEPWVLSARPFSSVAILDTSVQGTDIIRQAIFSHDGTVLLTVGQNGIHRYELPEAYKVSGAVVSGSANFATTDCGIFYARASIATCNKLYTSRTNGQVYTFTSGGV